ncbi:glycosyltransferase family 2 protein [uncultured Maribacter sp.]|uniref:glycosyltransferase family 2 protein n=1 Tax=uncultured Maribacter sp. TaxID=431308 RepID=UPI0026323F5C|nr:glycosyltransferase family 2 protein [uncultured Maribacter sp.]
MIYIVIPVFNRWHFTKICLQQLEKQSYIDFKTIIIDDGSSDETSEELTKNHPDIIVLKGDGSLWWTGGINLGIAYALKQGATYIVTLNNDTIPAHDYVEQLLKASKIEPKALIGSTGTDANTKEINFCGERVKWISDSAVSLKDSLTKDQQFGLHEVSYFPGRGLLIPKIVFDTIGLFDRETFPHYMADYDFTLRARKAGFKVYCSLDTKLATYPEASGANQLMEQKSWKNYREHLFGIKGAANLKYYYTYVFRHCPWYFLPINITIGTLKRLINYWR